MSAGDGWKRLALESLATAQALMTADDHAGTSLESCDLLACARCAAVTRYAGAVRTARRLLEKPAT